MTWTAAIMPDDALPPDSLVRRILKPTSNSDQIRSSEPPPPAPMGLLPLTLWQVLEPILDACVLEALVDLDDPDADPDPYYPEWRQEVFDVIEALRDWPQIGEAEIYREAVGNADNDDQVDGFLWGARWYRDSLRALLTEQASIARGDHPSQSSSPSGS